jgi:hypothetical protein
MADTGTSAPIRNDNLIMFPPAPDVPVQAQNARRLHREQLWIRRQIGAKVEGAKFALALYRFIEG